MMYSGRSATEREERENGTGFHNIIGTKNTAWSPLPVSSILLIKMLT